MKMYENYPGWILRRIIRRSKLSADGCLIFQGGTKHRYGLVSVRGKPTPAARALYMATHKVWDLPRSVFIRHKCDTPRCVNIDHILAGSAQDNTQDMISRGRKAKRHKPHTRHRKTKREIYIARGCS